MCTGEHNIKGLNKIMPCSFAYDEYRRQISNFLLLLTLVGLSSHCLTLKSCVVRVVSSAVFGIYLFSCGCVLVNAGVQFHRQQRRRSLLAGRLVEDKSNDRSNPLCYLSFDSACRRRVDAEVANLKPRSSLWRERARF
jgi:hypothetical protein